MAVPHELGDRTAERVPDRDETVDADGIGHGHHVVGAVGQPEAGAAGEAPPVAAEVDGHDAVAVGEDREGGEPVELGARHQSVDQKEDGRPRRAVHLVDEGLAPARDLDLAARRPGHGCELLDGKAQHLEH